MEWEAEQMLDSLFTAAERYLKRCKWWDIALLKVCLCALGVLIGLAVPRAGGRERRPGQPRPCSSLHMCL